MFIKFVELATILLWLKLQFINYKYHFFNGSNSSRDKELAVTDFWAIPQSSPGNAFEKGEELLSNDDIPNGSAFVDGFSNGLLWNILLEPKLLSEWNLSLLLKGWVTAGVTGEVTLLGSRGGRAGAFSGGVINGVVGMLDWVVGGKGLVLNDCTGDEGTFSVIDFLGLNSNSSSSEPRGLKSSSVKKYKWY